MLYGFSRGRGGGRGRIGGDMGFRFRGYSPLWPYTGRGRGGLPRCGYFLGRATAPIPHAYTTQSYYPGSASAAAPVPLTDNLSRDEELNYMQEQAVTIKRQLEKIESRMRDLDKKGN